MKEEECVMKIQLMKNLWLKLNLFMINYVNLHLDGNYKLNQV